jgi:hypothetical protein
MSRPGLAQPPKRAKEAVVHPEDRALLGSNSSAAVDSNTAGLGGIAAAQAGLLRVRCQCDKSQGVWGTASPSCDFRKAIVNQNKPGNQKSVRSSGHPAFHAEPVHRAWSVFTFSTRFSISSSSVSFEVFQSRSQPKPFRWFAARIRISISSNCEAECVDQSTS